MPTVLRSALLLVALLALSGCGRFRKAKECEVLAKAVSGWLAKQPTPSGASTEPKKLAAETRVTAQRYDDLDRELGALDIKSRDLVRRVAAYRKIATQSAHSLRDVADALERDNFELARKKRVEFDETVKAEASLVAEINAECRR